MAHSLVGHALSFSAEERRASKGRRSGVATLRKERRVFGFGGRRAVCTSKKICLVRFSSAILYVLRRGVQGNTLRARVRTQRSGLGLSLCMNARVTPPSKGAR